MRFNILLAGVLSLCFAWAIPVSGSDSGGTIYGQVEIHSKNGQSTGDNSGAVVYLKEVNGNKGFTPEKKSPTMASENMQFNPGVLPVLVGTSVIFPNKDDTIHNAFSVSKPKKFDLGRYGYGEENPVRFDKPGIEYVFCKIHPRMSGCILVLENPYFTLTDEKGNYSIQGVPPGSYTVVGWFPLGDGQERQVDLTKDTKAKADFSLVKLRESNSRKKLAEDK
jgi:plastocyanin